MDKSLVKPNVPPKPKWLRGKPVEILNTEHNDTRKTTNKHNHTLAMNGSMTSAEIRPLNSPPLTVKLKCKLLSAIGGSSSSSRQRRRQKTSALSPLAIESCSDSQELQTESCPIMTSLSRQDLLPCGATSGSLTSASSLMSLSRSKSLDMKRGATSWYTAYRELLESRSSPTISESPEEWSTEDVDVESSCDSSEYNRGTSFYLNNNNTATTPAQYQSRVTSCDNTAAVGSSICDSQTLPQPPPDYNSNIIDKLPAAHARSSDYSNNRVKTWQTQSYSARTRTHCTRSYLWRACRQDAVSGEEEDVTCLDMEDGRCSSYEGDREEEEDVTQRSRMSRAHSSNSACTTSSSSNSSSMKPSKVHRSVSTDSGLGRVRRTGITSSFSSVYNLRKELSLSRRGSRSGSSCVVRRSMVGSNLSSSGQLPPRSGSPCNIAKLFSSERRTPRSIVWLDNM